MEYAAIADGGKNLLYYLGFYTLEKRTARGNVIELDVDCGPSRTGLGVGISYQGIGFRHRLGGSWQTPAGQQEADACLERVLAAVCEFEEALLPGLDRLYPETPDWFVPSWI